MNIPKEFQTLETALRFESPFNRMLCTGLDDGVDLQKVFKNTREMKWVPHKIMGASQNPNTDERFAASGDVIVTSPNGFFSVVDVTTAASTTAK